MFVSYGQAYLFVLKRTYVTNVHIAHSSFAHCQAFEMFHVYFRDRIVDLTTRFPENAKLTTGEPFWAGHKKFPRALAFDPHNAVHVEFVVSAANIFAGVLKVHGPKHPSELNDPAHRWMAEYRDSAWAAKVCTAKTRSLKFRFSQSVCFALCTSIPVHFKHLLTPQYIEY